MRGATDTTDKRADASSYKGRTLGQADAVNLQCERMRGVVLLEAIVAVGILALIISALLVLASRTNAAMYSATDRLIASYLAQDVAEWVRARIDLNVAIGLSWDTAVGQAECPVGSKCGLETASLLGSGQLESCGSLNGCVLSRSTTNNFYRHSVAGGVATPFERRVTVDAVDFDGDTNDDEITYTIWVEWRGSGGVRERVEVLTTLYDPST